MAFSAAGVSCRVHGSNGSFDRKPIRKKLARELVDRFNTMLQGVAAMPEFSHVTHVDLRKTSFRGTKHQEYWENEMHPTVKGFRLVTDRFASALNGL